MMNDMFSNHLRKYILNISNDDIRLQAYVLMQLISFKFVISVFYVNFNWK